MDFNLIIQIAIGATGSLAAALVIFFVGILVPSVRTYLFYKTYRFEFEYDDDFGNVQWDVQWEGRKISVMSPKVHSEYLETVTVLVNNERPELELGNMNVGAEFKRIGKKPMYLRIANIARMKPERGITEHLIHIEFKLRKW